MYVLPTQKAKLVLAIGLLLILTFLIRFRLKGGGRKQSRAAFCFRHVLLTLAGFLRGGENLLLHTPDNWVGVKHRKNRKCGYSKHQAMVYCFVISVAG